METTTETASVILAAGRGSRMKEFHGNKALLPLCPEKSFYEGTHPILFQILDNLPLGQKAVVINHKKDDVKQATQDHVLTYCTQPILNGTGGALLAARPFLEELNCHSLIITMGDVPFIRRETYRALLDDLNKHSFVVLGFCPVSKKQYGRLEVQGDQVVKIIEWKYWRTYTDDKQRTIPICNSGVYAARIGDLLPYLVTLSSSPHKVLKEIDSETADVEEYFITDLVEYMKKDGLSVGYVVAQDEDEIMGIDDFPSLLKAQGIFRTGVV